MHLQISGSQNAVNEIASDSDFMSVSDVIRESTAKPRTTIRFCGGTSTSSPIQIDLSNDSPKDHSRGMDATQSAILVSDSEPSADDQLHTGDEQVEKLRRIRKPVERWSPGPF